MEYIGVLKVPLEKRKNKIDYFKNLQLAFENIGKNYIENLINSIPRRLEAIIKATGGLNINFIFLIHFIKCPLIFVPRKSAKFFLFQYKCKY